MNDKEIIALFNSRDQRAVAELQGKYGDYIKTVSYRILGDSYDADECVNDAYFAVWLTFSVSAETYRSTD